MCGVPLAMMSWRINPAPDDVESSGLTRAHDWHGMWHQSQTQITNRSLMTAAILSLSSLPFKSDPEHQLSVPSARLSARLTALRMRSTLQGAVLQGRRRLESRLTWQMRACTCSYCVGVQSTVDIFARCCAFTPACTCVH